MEKLRLKPCPFCGKGAKIKAISSTMGLSVWCGCDCGARTETYIAETSKEDSCLENIKTIKRMAVSAWNRRVNDETN